MNEHSLMLVLGGGLLFAGGGLVHIDALYAFLTASLGVMALAMASAFR